MKTEKNFYELLCLNSDDEIRKFLIERGKGPKPFCPVVFDVKHQEEQEENKNG